ncbi:MAG: hypothetical protein MN733_14835, partial [Nitrososphaera sp.]|nr:hypothetical protein [Nitrososphaera sp.]
MLKFTRYSQDETQNALDYRVARYALISRVEESGDPKELPYADSDGIPTIGIGFNLRVKSVVDAVLDALGFDRADPAEQGYIDEIKSIASRNYKNMNSQLQHDLNDVMLRRSMDPNVTGTEPAKRSTFEFNTTTEIQEVFDSLIDTYEDQVDSWLSGIPDSKERTVLVSLAWNGILAESNNLKEAIVADDRAEAWYEIRYRSNSDGV